MPLFNLITVTGGLSKHVAQHKKDTFSGEETETNDFPSVFMYLISS